MPEILTTECPNFGPLILIAIRITLFQIAIDINEIKKLIHAYILYFALKKQSAELLHANLEKIDFPSTYSAKGVDYFVHVLLNCSVRVSSFNVDDRNSIQTLLARC